MANPLARVVMKNVSNKVNEKDGTTRYYREEYSHIKDHEDMIKDIINNRSKPESNTGIKKMMTLEELAQMIKGNSQ